MDAYHQLSKVPKPGDLDFDSASGTVGVTSANVAELTKRDMPGGNIGSLPSIAEGRPSFTVIDERQRQREMTQRDRDERSSFSAGSKGSGEMGE